MQNNTCWNCGKAVERSLVCSACQSLQPPAGNYYDLFDLEHHLDLDLSALEQRFYTLSRKLHPDLYFRRPLQERQYSLDATAILNDAYRTLRDPVARAEYLLKENGFNIGEQKSNKVPPELLEEVFALNLALEELREGDSAARGELEAARNRFAALRDEVDRQLASKFTEYDRTGDREVLAEIRGILNRRKYIRNLVEEVEKELVEKGS